MAAIISISVDQGSNLTVNIPITDAITKAPVDLTGATARAQVRPTYGAPNVLIDASTTNGKLTISGNTVTWEISPADTANEHYAATDDSSIACVYDIKVTLGAQTFTPASGKFTVNRAVTR